MASTLGSRSARRVAERGGRVARTTHAKVIEMRPSMRECSTMKYRGLAKGATIELSERLPFPDGQLLRVSVEPWPSCPRSCSAQAIRQAMHAPPHLSRANVDELEAAIAQGRIPVNDGFVLNHGK